MVLRVFKKILQPNDLVDRVDENRFNHQPPTIEGMRKVDVNEQR